MAVGREIRDKIKSVKSTQKITRAMQMVAAGKMRKAQERMQASRPYSEKMRAVIGHLALGHPEYKNAFMIEREATKKVGFILVTSDRGLCGGLNVNEFRKLIGVMKDWRAQSVEMVFSVIGAKGAGFVSRNKGQIISEKTHLGDRPTMDEIIGPVKVMLDAYADGEIDRLYVVYNEFVNTMAQQPTVRQVLPLEPVDDPELKHHWDYIYEPDAPEVLDALLRRYVEAMVYQAVVENSASEMSARMVAMKAATDNAGKLIEELQLVYNKARQAAITSELADIIGGASAV
jgi:F-type H+-transporting ATPase subunit gamma